MRIQHNLNSMFAAKNIVRKTRSTERLASGYKINRAADNAAGLSISEKMRAQIRGIDQAHANAQDGISLIQTADGALSEVQSILHRVRELTVQGANDTNTDIDRESIQLEIEGLLSELDRVAFDTEFNTRKILDGTYQEGPGGPIDIAAKYSAVFDFNTLSNGTTLTMRALKKFPYLKSIRLY